MTKVKNFFKSAGRYLLSILPAFLFFTTLLFSLSVPVFASTSGELVTDKTTLRKSGSTTTIDTRVLSEYIDVCGQNNTDIAELELASLTWLFFTVYNDGYNALNSTLSLPNGYDSISVNRSSSVSRQFNSSQTAFDEDFLRVYYDIFRGNYDMVAISDDNSSGVSHLIDSTLPDFISIYYAFNGKSVPTASNMNGLFWKPVRYQDWNIGQPISAMAGGQRDFFKFYLPFNKFSSFLNSFLLLYSDSILSDPLDNTTVLPVPDFKDVISNSKFTFYPTGNVGKVSWKNDAFFRGKEHNLRLNYQYFTFYAAGNLFGVQDLDHCYCVPFFTNGTDTYYGGICYYLETEIYYSGHMPRVSDIIVKTCNMLNNCVDYHDTEAYIAAFDNDNATSFRAKNSDMDDNTLTNYPYAFLYDPAWFNFRFTTLDKFDPSLPDSGTFLYCPYGFFYKFYNSTNVTQTLDYTCINSSNFGPAPDKNNCDFGFIISDTPLIMDGWGKDIETEKIPNDYYITVSGDTIYDYSITNPETGDTTTINQYITNNYNFPPKTEPDTSGDSSGSESDSTVDSGSGSGNGGGVNVNVTVNNNIGGGGGGSYDMPDTSFFDDYLDDALEESTGIRKFIKDFFNSVPGEITKLICTGLVLAILCRLIGR